MGMYEAIKNFNTQFSYQPMIENTARLSKSGKCIVVGMGGSALAAGLLKVWKPELDLIVHRGYGLPPLGEEEMRSRLVVLSSYSGNTEEVLDAYDETKKRGVSVMAVGVGGELLRRAQEDGAPYVRLPDTGIQPRSALGFSFMAFLKIMKEEDALMEASRLADELKPEDFEKEGKRLAENLRSFVPIIYSSLANKPIAYAWKAKFNETAKIPAFFNVLPELNHNEMTGFDLVDSTRRLSDGFSFIMLKDGSDYPRVQKRMSLLGELLKERGFSVEVLELRGSTIFFKIFSSLVLADWVSYYLAQFYGVESEQIPMVEDFKRRMKENY